MKQKLNKNKNFYINLGFFVFVSELTFLFLGENLLKHYSISSNSVRALISVCISIGITWLFINKRIAVKIIFLSAYISLIAFYSHIAKEKNNTISSKNRDLKFFKGNWSIKEDNLILKLNINDSTMVMIFFPQNIRMNFQYKIQKKNIYFFNNNESENFQWQIIKLTKDSLVVKENEQILRFNRDY